MAVLSRPSLRSSRRENAASNLPTTEDVQVPRHSRPGKRTRDSSTSNESNASSKKLRSASPFRSRGIISPQTLALYSLPIRDRQPLTTKPVTQLIRSRKPDPVLVQTPLNASAHAVNATNGLLHYGINQNLPPIAEKLDKRSLRSHDGGSRTKSELAPYFSNYDELISIEPKEPDTLTADTVLHISDEPTKYTFTDKLTPSYRKPGRGRPPSRRPDDAPVSSQTIEWPEEIFTTLNNATRIDLSTADHRLRKTTKDPLDDSLYLKVHAREERKEKQLRNIEKERAMHEKFQLERLMDGLKGHDWLRVMGISGITDGEKKAYVPKRDYLMSEVRLLLEKFRLWKEEEKRRKTEKEEIMEEDEDEDSGVNHEAQEGKMHASFDGSNDAVSDGDPPDYTDVDASAARQLHMEAVLATKAHIAQKSCKRPLKHPPPKTPSREKPFTSFYEKPYMRAAAIGKHRRSGRSRTAFGQPIPEPEQRDFVLPQELRTTTAVLESAKRMRMLKRKIGE